MIQARLGEHIGMNSKLAIFVQRTANLISVRAARARLMLRAGMRWHRRRELFVMDYVLPFIRRRSAHDLRIHARSRSTAVELFFGRESFEVDRVAYFGIFLEGWYDANYRGASVVDVGAHKGYYSAFALLEGAAEVRSYEPESANFAVLERTAAGFEPTAGSETLWIANNAAVGAKPGQALLHVSAESAGHSLVQEQSTGPRRSLGSETVRVIAMRDVLNEASQGGHPLIVKVDAEGAECDIVLGTPVDAWSLVDHVFLEVHDFARCTSSEIVNHLRGAGFQVVLHEADAEAELIGLKRQA